MPLPVVVFCATLVHAATLPPAQLPATLSQLRAAVEQVLFNDGDPAALPPLVPDRTLRSGDTSTDITWLYDAVRNSDRQRLVEAWDRLRGWEDAIAPPPRVDPRRVRALTSEILADEAYRPIRVASWIDPWLPSIERLFDLLFAPFLDRAEAASPWRKAATVGLYALLLATTAGLLVRATRQRPGKGIAPPETGLVTLAETARSAAEWLAESRNEAAAGRHEAALARLYLAVLRQLDEQGRLPFDLSRTNRENTKAAAHDPEAAALLGELGPLVDAVIYGRRRCSGERWQHHLAHAERLWRSS